MTVVVTGASGHVGVNLVSSLLAAGRKVRVLVHQQNGFDGEVEKIRGDITVADSLEEAFAGAETVFHLAARISISGDQGGLVTRTNVEGVRNVARAALRAGARRMVHVSSIHAFEQEPLDQPLDETRARCSGPRHFAYDRSKALGEAALREVMAEGLDAVIVHPTAIVGPADRAPSRMGRVCLDLYHRRLPALVRGGFDWVDVRDVVEGILAAETRGRPGENYLLSGNWHAVSELAALVGEITGVQPPKMVVPMWLARLSAPLVALATFWSKEEPRFSSEALAALRANRRVLHSKAGRELGYQPRPLRQTLQDLFSWFESQGQLQSARGS